MELSSRQGYIVGPVPKGLGDEWFQIILHEWSKRSKHSEVKGIEKVN